MNSRFTLNHSRRTTFGLAAIISLVAATYHAEPGFGDMVTLSATDSGFVTEMGGSSKGDGTLFAPAADNYSVGQELHYADGSLGMPPGSTPTAYMDRNNYFVFDLSTVSGPIIGATLMLPAGLFESVDATETFHLIAPDDPGAALFDAEMLDVANSIGFGEFDDPGDPMIGVAAALYGNIEAGAFDILATAVVSSADDFTTLSITFDPLGLDYLNLFSGGPVFIGGTVSTIAPGMTTQQPFGGTGPTTPELFLITIPEPNCLLLIGIAMGLAGCGVRRTRICSLV